MAIMTNQYLYCMERICKNDRIS